MGLTKCLDCGHDVSDMAPACPNCGRPASAAGKMERCEVVLKPSHGLGLGAHWVLVAQKPTTKGLVDLLEVRYTSDLDLAAFQSSKPQFVRAREEITKRLLGAGWQFIGSASDELSLPRFQRSVDYETAFRPDGSTGAGITLTKLPQRTYLRNEKFDVLVDGAKVAEIRNGETLRLDLVPGEHVIQAQSRRLRTNECRIHVQPAAFERLSFGWLSGTRMARLALRGEGLPLSPGDEGKPFE